MAQPPADLQPDQPETTVFRSKLPDIYIPKNLPLHSYCFENKVGSRPCLINGGTGEVMTYDEVELVSRRIGAGLDKIGVKQGEVIMLLLPNCPEIVLAFLAASFRGAIVTAANPLFTAAEISKQAKSSKAKLIITQACSIDKIRGFAAESGVKLMCVDSAPDGCAHFSELTNSNENDLPEINIDPDDVVWLMYSSGTTGLPKGVMLTHKGLITNVAQLVDGENPNLYFHSEDVILCAMLMFHVAAHSFILCGLRAGSAILFMPLLDIGKLLEVIQKHKVTIAPMGPPIVLAIAKSPETEKYDLSSVRLVVYGSAPMGKEVEDAISAKFSCAKVAQAYGMTEAGSVLALSLGFAKEPFEVKSGSCGTVLRNAEMKIVDPDTGASLPRNKAGEFCIRGDQIMKGYLNDPEATAVIIDKEGWLHTGDIGYIDNDDELFIVDRLKELIKYKGFQVPPAELEALLIAHPNIHDAAVVGMKDEAAGEVPLAYVVKSKGSQITEDEVKQYISDQVVYYKRISKVFFIEAIPKTALGKISRKELRAKLAAGGPN